MYLFRACSVIKEDVMDRVYGLHGGEGKCMHGFSLKRMKEVDCILKKQGARVWVKFVLLRAGTSDKLL